MNSFRRKLAIAIAICAIISLTSGVSGFTSVTADRSTSVAIVDQTDAYISFPEEVNCENGKNDIIMNKFPSKLNDGKIIVTPQNGNLTFGFHGDSKEEFEDGNSNIFEIDDEAPLKSGESLTIRIDSETTNTAENLKIEVVDASGPTVAVDTSTTVDIKCN
jgi:hypothetical protein